jgi:hypothetical protein
VQALRRVQRLSGEDERTARPAESLLLSLQAEELFTRHIADQTLLRRALELDANNARARRLLDRMSRGEVDADARKRRYGAAGVIGALALIALSFIGLRKRKGPGARPVEEPAAEAPPAVEALPAAETPVVGAPPAVEAPAVETPPAEAPAAPAAEASAVDAPPAKMPDGPADDADPAKPT